MIVPLTEYLKVIPLNCFNGDLSGERVLTVFLV